MVLSLNSALDAAFHRGTAELRFRVLIWHDAFSFYEFIDGRCSHSSADQLPKSVSSVTGVKREIDVEKSATQAEECTVTFRLDGATEELVTDTGVLGAWMEIFVGTDDVDKGNYAPYFAGICEEPRCSVGEVEITARTLERKFGEVNILGGWIARHPLQALRDVVTRCGLQESAHFDAATFDPVNYTDISHFVVARASVADLWFQQSYEDPQRAQLLIDGLVPLLNARFLALEDGKMALRKFDSSAAVADTWTDADIDEIEPSDLYKHLCNQYRVSSHPTFSEGQTGREAYQYQSAIRDLDSQNRFKLVAKLIGNGRNVREKEFLTDWVTGVGQLQENGAGQVFTSAAVPGPGSYFPVGWDLVTSMAGCRFYPSVWADGDSQPATAQLSDSRTAYFRIENEIIEVDRCTVPTKASNPYAVDTYYHDPYVPTTLGEWTDLAVWDALDLGCVQTYNFPGKVQYRVKARGCFGSKAAAHATSTRIADITIPVFMGEQKVARFANGGLMTRVTTGFSKYALQIGDFVNLVTDRFRAYGRKGLTTSTVFEIIGKDTDPFASPPKITWTLLFAREDVPLSVSIGHLIRKPHLGGRGEHDNESVTNAEFGEKYVVSGLAWSKTAGFVGACTAGVASGVLGRSKLEKAVSYTFAASKDTYVYLDLRSGSMSYMPVANGAAAPADYNQTMLPLAKVVTDGVGITTVTDLRPTKALHGTKLVDGSVGDAPIAAGRALPVDTAIDASTHKVDLSLAGFLNKNLDNVADTATYKRVAAAFVGAAGALDFNAAGWLNKTLDNLPDGSTYKRVIGTAVGAGNKIDFNLAGFLNKTLDYVGDGATYKRVAAAFVGAGNALDFAAAGWLNKTLDNVADGATYLRVTGVSAGHQVQTASIASDSVTTPKVATGAIGPNRIAVGTAPGTINFNPHLQIYEDG